MHFLASVPFFHTRIPASELPRIAALMERVEWAPSTTIVRVGHQIEGFAVIMRGEAIVSTPDENGRVREQASLGPGDHWGARTLKRDVIADYSVSSAAGVEPLVVLFLTRKKFLSLDFKGPLHLRKRLGVYEGMWKDDAVELDQKGSCPMSPGQPPLQQAIQEEEVVFVVEALKAMPEAAGRGLDGKGCSLETLRKVAQTALHRKVLKGECITQEGQRGETFFIIESGSFDIVPTLRPKAKGASLSAEGVVSCEHLATRSRKHEILAVMNLSHHVPVQADSDDDVNDVVALFSGGFVAREATRSHSAETIDEHESHNCFRESMRAGSPACGTLPEEEEAMPQPVHRKDRRHQTDAVGLKGATKRQMHHADKWWLASFKKYKGFKIGDLVKVAAHLDEASSPVGHVVDVPSGRVENGVLEVEFPAPVGRICIAPEELVIVQELHSAGVLKAGDTWGELACLFNGCFLTTVRAREDSMVFTISARNLRSIVPRTPKLSEWLELLSEVPILESLLQMERLELARNAEGLVDFAPGETVLIEGGVREDPKWYIVEHGSCFVSHAQADGSQGPARELTRGLHFGEREILRQESVSAFSVVAGPRGLKVLVFGAEIVNALRCFETKYLAGVVNETSFRRFDSSRDYEKGVDIDTGRIDIDADPETYMTGICKRCPGSFSTNEIPMLSLQPVALLGEGAFGAVFLVESPVKATGSSSGCMH